MKKSKIQSRRSIKSSKKGSASTRSKRRTKERFPILIFFVILIFFLIWRIIVVVPQHKKVGLLSNKSFKTEIVEKNKASNYSSKEKGKKKSSNVVKENIKSKVIQENEKEGKINHHEGKKVDEISDNFYEPLYSIVVDDVGSNLELLQKTIENFPRFVTFAILPFQKYSKESAEFLKKEGFSILLHSPMEAKESHLNLDYKYIIRANSSQKEVEEILNKQLEDVPFVEGVNNHTGSKATEEEKVMRYVMKYLRKKNLYFLDSRTTPLTVAYKVALEEGVLATERKVFLDDDLKEEKIREAFDEFIIRGRKEKSSVAIGHFKEVTLKILKEKIAYWTNRGVKFVKLSDIIFRDDRRKS